MKSEHGEIIIYEADSHKVEVLLDQDTVWLTQRQMAELFDTTSDNISLHLKNIYSDEELEQEATTEDFSAVQKEGKRQVRRALRHYNLDAIISVGYRVNSKRGIRFRQWATSVLRKHLVKGYTANERRLAEKGLSEMEQTVALLTKTLAQHETLSDEGKAVLDVVSRYARSWSLLLEYDEDRLELPGRPHPARKSLEYESAVEAIAALKSDLQERGEAGDLFGREKGHGLQAVLGNIEQTFGGRELYPSVEEKGAHLLYFVIKDHPFADGNKRIGSFLFLLYLRLNDLLAQSGINDNALVALALLIAESDPQQKELLIRLIVNFLPRNKTTQELAMAEAGRKNVPEKGKKTTAAAYRLKITLRKTKPPVWRRVQVPAAMKLSRLHDVIQLAMGWSDYHLHQFMIGANAYGPTDLDEGWADTGVLNEKKYRLCDLEADMQQGFSYEYDFGDGWQHAIKLEKVIGPDEKTPGHPVLLAGKRACPPEDVGGPFGYEDFLAAVGDPVHPEHENMREWFGRPFDPELFNMKGINRVLKKMK